MIAPHSCPAFLIFVEELFCNFSKVLVMTSKKQSFENRLKNLDHTGPEPTEQEPKREKSSNGKFALYLLVVVLGLILPSLAVILSLREVSSGLSGTLVASLGNDSATHSSAQEDPGFLKGYFGRKLGLYDSRNKGPLPYLPEAPKGWVRVTTMDARDPDVLAKIQQRWPRENRANHHSLEQNAGYKHLQFFVKSYRKPGFEERILAETRTRAMYLHPNGEYMSVRMRFTSEKSALGAPENKSEWIETLATKQAKRANSNELVERNRLAGYDIVNLTVPMGESIIQRPIGRAYNTRNGLRVSVPLSHRVIVSVDGITKPNVIARLIKDIDQNALAKLFN